MFGRRWAVPDWAALFPQDGEIRDRGPGAAIDFGQDAEADKPCLYRIAGNILEFAGVLEGGAGHGPIDGTGGIADEDLAVLDGTVPPVVLTGEVAKSADSAGGVKIDHQFVGMRLQVVTEPGVPYGTGIVVDGGIAAEK